VDQADVELGQYGEMNLTPSNCWNKEFFDEVVHHYCGLTRSSTQVIENRYSNSTS
jgi:hypothetical protein